MTTDNVTLPGTGIVVAADDVAGVQYQRMKLTGGAADSVEPILGDSTNGIDVDVTRLPALVAGSALIGKVGIDKIAGEDIQVANGTAEKSIRVSVASDSTGQIKLAAGTAEIGKLAAGTAEIGKLAAGEAYIGAVGRNYVKVLVTPTLTTGATYVANDYVGTDHTPMEFANVVRANGGYGHIVDAVLFDYVIASVAAELWLFEATLDPGHDSAAWTITDAESLTCIGVIPFGGTAAPYYASANNSISVGAILGGMLGFKCASNSRSIFGCLVTRGAPAYTNGLVSVRIGVLED